MGFNIGPRVVRATGGGISRAGNYRIHQFPPDIVTDGLVIHLDAGNVNSLPVNDPTTITDLTGNGNNGALTNGASYSQLYGGVVQHNTDSSTDDYINVTNGGSNIMQKDFTLDFWLRYTDINSGSYTNLWSTNGYGGTTNGFAFYSHGNDIRIFGNPTQSTGNLFMIESTGLLANDTWYNIVITRDLNTTEVICYKNAAQVGIYTGCTSDYEEDGDGTYSFGTRDGNNYTFEGYSSVMKGYNRALSPAEILQNYESGKIRHGVTSSTTFTPTCTGSGGKVDLLCIAGGGGGGIQHGGGGGAGGYQEFTGLSIKSAGTYTAAVGMGGTASPNSSSYGGVNGSNGGNSVFSGTDITTITSLGGGGGSCLSGNGGSAIDPGSAGGSGGGGALDGSGGSGTVAGGAGTSGQGFAGGSHFGHGGANTYGGGAGGGGAGGVGQDGQSSVNASAPYIAGAGGPGKTSSITGTPVTRAGGGGGGSHDPDPSGAGGSGGGGNGGIGNGTDTANGDNAIPRTGSGGGGSGAFTEPAGSGAHGIIILRYPAEDYNAELLIVGGGGGGGACNISDGGAGGGGAGGLLYYSSVPISSGKSYLVRTGVSGSGSSTDTVHADNGGDSIFGDKVAIGGGGGGSTRDSSSVPSGGSGGAAGSDVSPNTGGTGIDGQGHKGGDNDTGNTGAGGGGASEAGGDGTGNVTAGAGGDGLAYSITGSSVTYAGGGGGGKYSTGTGDAGAGGAGGGGAGGKGANGTGGTANTGGGGGGGGMVSGSAGKSGAAGGTGIVLIAYKGPQRGEGGTIDQTSRPGYTIHKFTDAGPDRFIG